MVFIAACPQCARRLRVPFTCRGETVRCPACEATFPAPEPPETVSSRVPMTTSGVQVGESAITLAAVEALSDEGSSAPSDEPTGWTARDRWRRVHSGLGWVALGVAASFVVLFLRHLPALLLLSGVDLAVPHDDYFWNGPHNLVHPLRGSVGLTVLFSTFCLLAGLFRCLLYPV